MMTQIMGYVTHKLRDEARAENELGGRARSASGEKFLLFEIQESPGAPMDDVIEVSQYVAALEHGLKNRLRHRAHRTPANQPGRGPAAQRRRPGQSG